jgi:hypothetical protein
MCICVSIMGMFLVAGCSTTSMNYQRSVARGTGDLTATATLEQTSVTREQFAANVNKVVDFLNKTPLPDNMTRDELMALIKDKIDNAALKSIVDKFAPTLPSNVNIVQAKRLTADFIKGLSVGINEFNPAEK